MRHLKVKVFGESKTFSWLQQQPRRCGVPLTTSLFSLTFQRTNWGHSAICVHCNRLHSSIADCKITICNTLKSCMVWRTIIYTETYLFLFQAKLQWVALCNFAASENEDYLDWLLSHRSFNTWVICDDDTTDYMTRGTHHPGPKITYLFQVNIAMELLLVTIWTEQWIVFNMTFLDPDFNF